MKSYLTLLFALVLNAIVPMYGQSANENPPVSWAVEAIQSTEDETKYTLTFYAKIDKGYHLYAIELPSEDAGPLPTEFNFQTLENIELTGTMKEGTYETEMDESFQVEVNYYEDEAIFTQQIQIKDLEKKAFVTGIIYYMVCNETMCVPLEYPFSKIIRLNK